MTANSTSTKVKPFHNFTKMIGLSNQPRPVSFLRWSHKVVLADLGLIYVQQAGLELVAIACLCHLRTGGEVFTDMPGETLTHRVPHFLLNTSSFCSHRVYPSLPTQTLILPSFLFCSLIPGLIRVLICPGKDNWERIRVAAFQIFVREVLPVIGKGLSP